MSGSSDGTEKRRFERVPLIVDLFYKVERPPEIRIKFGDRVETAYMTDISEDGIGFICGTALPKSCELDVTFNLTTQESGTVRIRAVGVIRYCFYQPDRTCYRIGLAFTLIDENDGKAIAQYVAGLKNSKKLYE